MQEISAKILEQKIVESKIVISQNLADKFEISVNCRANLRAPKSIEDNSILLNMVLNIETKDEELKIELVGNVVFELEHLLDNYDDIAEEKLLPMATKSLLNSLDDILVVMGYNKLELAKKV